MLLFSLLHTSSGTCCSAETNHGLLRLCVCPPHPTPTPPSVALTFCYLFIFFMFLSISVSFLAILFCFLRLPPSRLLFPSLALLPFGHAEAALPQHGHPGCPEEGKRPGSQRSSPPGRNTRKTGDLFLSSTSSAAPSGCTLWFYFP